MSSEKAAGRRFALDGLRVIDFGQYIAGPMTAMFLADDGADVIRVDQPGGPRWKTPANATWNRNKRSIVLDLKQQSDLEVARQLIASADVVVENFRPGVMAKLGLGPESMTACNQKLVYCSLPGFASDDPRAGIRAWEGILGAAGGAYRADPAIKEPDPGAGRPIFTAVPYASMFGSFLAATSIVAALNARERTGLGQIVEVPLFNAMFTTLGVFGLKVHNRQAPPPEFNWTRTAPGKDGRWFLYYSLNKKFGKFLEVSGMAEWAKSGLSIPEMTTRFNETIAKKSAWEWDQLCDDIGTEGAPCLTSAEWLEHPQALASEIVADFDDPELGRFRGPGIFMRLSKTPAAVRKPRAVVDSHRSEILEEIARKKPSVPAKEANDDRAGAFSGIRVLDLCMVLAGPTLGRTMAEFGADVIKIDVPRLHTNQALIHIEGNRGKRSIALDLKTPDGQQIFWKLLDKADVVLQSFRPGIADQLGVGYEAVRQRKPGIIYCSLSAYGQKGPYARRPGHEQVLQAISGLFLRYGGDKPASGPFPSNDYGTGIMGCYAVMVALLHRKKTGEGQHVDASLAYTTTFLQSNLIQRFSGKVWDEPSGQNILGSGPLNRAYQARDGWLFIAAKAHEIARCPLLADLASKSAEEMERALEARFKEKSVDEWVGLLTAANISAQRVALKFDSLMQDPQVLAMGLSVTREHDDRGLITTTAPSVRLSRTPVILGRTAPKPGADAASILAEIGMEKSIDQLRKNRVILNDVFYTD